MSWCRTGPLECPRCFTPYRLFYSKYYIISRLPSFNVCVNVYMLFKIIIVRFFISQRFFYDKNILFYNLHKIDINFNVFINIYLYTLLLVSFYTIIYVLSFIIYYLKNVYTSILILQIGCIFSVHDNVGV